LWRDFVVVKRHTVAVEVGVRELRDHLSRYLDHARAGTEITVTEHGRAVARLVGLDQPRVIDQLIADGLVTPAPAPKRRWRGPRVAKPAGTISDLVAEQRR
jgi:prevent-host-death family protein